METISIEFTKDELESQYDYNEFFKHSEREELKLSIKKKFAKALEQLNAPKIGDRCAFWNDDKRVYELGVLDKIYRKDIKEYHNGKAWYMHCAKLKKEAEF